MEPPLENMNIANDKISGLTERQQNRKRIEELEKALKERLQSIKESNRLFKEEYKKRNTIICYY